MTLKFNRYLSEPTRRVKEVETANSNEALTENHQHENQLQAARSLAGLFSPFCPIVNSPPDIQTVPGLGEPANTRSVETQNL